MEKVQKIISDEPKKNLIFAKDPSGTSLLHKAVYYGWHNIIEYILKNYPNTCSQKDQVRLLLVPLAVSIPVIFKTQNSNTKVTMNLGPVIFFKSSGKNLSC